MAELLVQFWLHCFSHKFESNPEATKMFAIWFQRGINTGTIDMTLLSTKDNAAHDVDVKVGV